MKTYRFTFATGYVGTEEEEFIEVDDDTTDDEVHRMWVDWIWNYVDGEYTEVEQ